MVMMCEWKNKRQLSSTTGFQRRTVIIDDVTLLSEINRKDTVDREEQQLLETR
jgi:hypothetical protein